MSENRRRTGRRGCVVLANLLTLLLFGLILVVVAVAVAAFGAPDLIPQLGEMVGLDLASEVEQVAVEPSPTSVLLAVVPTAADTPQPEGVLAPTWTPNRPLAALPATATNTRRPTPIPSTTPTFPPPTATRTPTSTPTPTDTPGPSPTVTNTRAPFPFTRAAASPNYLQNFANNAGCNWLGIAGEVWDLQGNPVPSGQYRVHVWGSGIDERPPVGAAPAYGPAGYEQFVFDAPVVRDYNVQLETVNGTAVSQVYQVQTRASCNQNLLLFNFVQNH